ncbi:ATP-binding cassette domain-containing protein [Galbitalea sp. SE-J8]|uniref:ABC transporter ATP-binding protein n=1 Tax=Galbitalea sp. SE-J8 TaxID=3054952 RepID=UPI00259CE1DD|nr:ATP-binding cassette domain-containing protein [Galbitalea sp. SE-J8]MDM4763317.1 ATP-binding cassette domain-containing protein [Galbitalea sp. SE-J8]
MPVLRLSDVSLVRQGRPLLDEVDWTVEAGERWALIGANGAGKSTLLSLAGAVTHPSSGTVEILGERLGRVDIRAVREHIGHVNPRHPLASPLTIEQVALTGFTGTTELMMRWQPTDAELARVAELLRTLGIAGVAQSPWTTLSQGERGRALIARALVTEPALVLLDEPATGLDVAAREKLLGTIDAVHAAHPELASVLVTHHLEELPRSTTHAMLIRHGRITAAGDADAVLTTERVSHAFDHPIEIERRDGRWSARAL